MVTREDERVLPLGDAIRLTYRQAGLSQTDLAGVVGVHQTQISQYVLGRSEPSLATLAAIDEACDRPRGHIARLAGYVSPCRETEDVIRGDPHLNAMGVDSVLAVYEVFRRRSIPEANDSHIPA